MKIIHLPINELKAAAYNPRRMDEKQLEDLRASIKEFGIVEPCVINKDKTIIGGHQRWKAAKLEGMTEMPCFELDLSKSKEKKLNLALNKIVGTWDENKLAMVVAEIEDDLLGFSEEEREQLATRRELMNQEESESEYDVDEDEELEKLFERHEKAGVNVEDPDIPVRKESIAFYCSTMDEYTAIKDFFKTTRKGELDIEKLVELIKQREQ